MSKFECNRCGKEIDSVVTVSLCEQRASIDASGQISDWTSVDHIGETKRVHCSECGEEIEGWKD